MENHKMVLFFGSLSKNEDFAEKIFSAENDEMVKDLAEKEGINLKLKDIKNLKEIFKKISELKDNDKVNFDELTDDELDSVSGGYMDRDLPKIFIFGNDETHNFDALKNGVAWKVISNNGREYNANFNYPISSGMPNWWDN